MTPDETRLAQFLYSFPEKPRRVDIDQIRYYYGCSHRFAKNIRTSWVDRGLAKHHPELNNAIYLMHEFEPLPDVDVKMIFSKISVPATAEGENEWEPKSSR